MENWLINYFCINKKKSERDLNQISGEALAAVGVVERESGGESRDGNAVFGRCGNDVTPRFLTIAHGLAEKVIHKQTLEIAIALECQFDVAQKDTVKKLITINF